MPNWPHQVLGLVAGCLTVQHLHRVRTACGLRHIGTTPAAQYSACKLCWQAHQEVIKCPAALLWPELARAAQDRARLCSCHFSSSRTCPWRPRHLCLCQLGSCRGLCSLCCGGDRRRRPALSRLTAGMSRLGGAVKLPLAVPRKKGFYCLLHRARDTPFPLAQLLRTACKGGRQVGGSQLA